MKTIQELKKAIQNKNLDNSLLVLKWSDFSFVAFEYIHAIAEFKNLEIKVIDDFDDAFSTIENNLFDFSHIDYLQVCILDKFKTKLTYQLEDLENVVVVCKDVDEKTLEYIIEKEHYFEIPKLQDWQIEDYFHVMCPGLSEPKIKWLCGLTNSDIYRIYNESKKIACFDKSLQEDVFDLIDEDNGYSDLTQKKKYNLTNTILSKDLRQVSTILKDIDNMDVEGVGLITILRKSFKIVIGIQMDKDATPEKLGIKSGQFNVVRAKNCNKFNNDKLKSIYKFLVDFDYNLKNGKVDMSKDRLVDYIICEVLS